MHQQSNVVGIQSREPTFTSKVLDDDLHQWGKHVLQEFKVEYSLEFVMVFSLDVRLIVLVNVLTLFHFSPTFGIPVASKMTAGDKVNVTPARFTSLLSSKWVTNNLANS